MVDREEQAADTAGFHHLDIQSFGENGDSSATDQLLVPCLRQHRLADRQQNDHHRDSNSEAEEQQDRPPRPVGDVAERQLSDHPSTTLPSRMWIFRRAASARSSSWVTTTRVVPSSLRRWNSEMIS